MKIQVKKLSAEAKLPSFGRPGDAGMDLYSAQDAVLKPGERISCPTGIAIKIPEGFVGLVWDKSGPSHKFGIKTILGMAWLQSIKTWARRSQISPEFVGKYFSVHNGRIFIEIFITEDMVGHRLGEFSPTRTFRGHGQVVKRIIEKKGSRVKLSSSGKIYKISN